MKFFNEENEKQLKEVFGGLKGDVTIALFTEGDCNTCKETGDFMSEIAALSDRIHLKSYDLKKDAQKAFEYGVTMVPSIVLLDPNGAYRGIKFNGIPAGHEINSFIPAILEISGAASEMPKDLEDRIMAIDEPTNIKVFVTLSCPHCAGAVQKAHKMALMNSKIEAEMIEAQTFGELADRYNVSGVPKIVINDKHELLGNQPIQSFLDAMVQG